jgi:hypothetical protein
MNPSCFSDRKGALYLEPTALSMCCAPLVPCSHSPATWIYRYVRRCSDVERLKVLSSEMVGRYYALSIVLQYRLDLGRSQGCGSALI